MLIPSPSEQPTGRCLAVLIGINDYRKGNGIPPLRNAVRDVQTVAQVLRDLHGYEVRLILDEQATLARLRTLLSQLPTEVSAHTRLVLYFAGHGMPDETDEDASVPQGFLIPQDAKRDDSGTFLPMAEVHALLSKLSCKHLLVLLDCCFAGAFRWSQTRSIRVRPATLYRERYERYLRDSAWQVITSAACDEQALDTVAGGKLGRRGEEGGNSPFAAALCRGLRGEADLPVVGHPDGVIVANELHVYVETSFSLLERQLGRAVQKPLLWSLDGRDKGQFIFFTPGRPLALPSALELSEANNPYRGLEPYDENDEKRATLFFGRNEVIEQLNRQVHAERLTVVSGISGSGKSSLVRIGLIRRLQHSPDWFVPPPVRPGNRPLSALMSIPGALGAPIEPDLATAVATWRTRNAGKKLLLCIDQLEELVTMGAEPADQQKFLAAIGKALSEADGYLHLVMTLRSDFEPHFSELLTPEPGTQVRFLVRPLNRQELRQVIEGPANERVLSFEPTTLVDQIIDEVAEMPGALPLLSFTMSELYRAYVRSSRSDRLLTEADYLKLGGVAGALSRRADEIFQSLDAEHQGTLRRAMLRMVAWEAGEMARRRVPMEELRYGKDHPEQPRVEMVLSRMQEARLIVSGRDSDGVPYVEPAHDKLILGWPQLLSFLKQEQETIAVHRLLTQEAAAWTQNQRNPSHLWSGNPRLPLIVDLQRKVPERFNALEGEFIESSRAEQQRLLEQERQRRQELEESLALAREQKRIAEEARAHAEQAREQAERQQQRADTEAFKLKQQLLATYVEQGRQLLVEKENHVEALLWLHRAQTGGSQEPNLPYLLHAAMQSVDATRGVLLGHAAGINSAAFSPDGRRIVTASVDHTARIWDAGSGRLLAELRGHRNRVRKSMFSPDGRRILTASWDQTAQVWDADSGNFLAELSGHTDRVVSAMYSPDGRRILTASWDQTARVFEADGGMPLLELKGHTDRVRNAMFSRDSRRIATASDDRTIRIWEAGGGTLLRELAGHEDIVWSVRFSPDDRYVVSASEDNTARVWESESGRLLAELNGHKSFVWGATFSPNGRQIVTASDDNTARIWDAISGRLLTELKGHRDSVRSARFSPDGFRILTASEDNTARIWDAERGQLIMELQGHHDRVHSARFSPNGQLIVTASEDKTARIWSADGGARLIELTGHEESIRRATFSPDGRRVVSASDDKTARIWDAEHGTLLIKLLGHRDNVRRATFSPDGHSILTASHDHTARIWDASGGRLLLELTGHGGIINAATFDPDGHRIVTASNDKSARIWDAEHGSLLFELTGHDDNINSAMFSLDSRRIVTASDDKTARVWDAGNGTLLSELTGHGSSVTIATFSPDGSRVLTASLDHSARVWDADSGKVLFELKGHRSFVWRAMYSPDGRRILTASDDKTTRVWDADGGRPLLELKGHIAVVNTATFSRDGRRILTGSDDRTALVWDVDSGKLLAKLKGHGDKVLSAVFSPDGSRILTAGQDKTARLWDFSPETRTPQHLDQLIRRYVFAQFEQEDSNLIVIRTPPPHAGQNPRQT